MPSSHKKPLLNRRHPAVVDLGCGCRRRNLSSLFSTPKPYVPSSTTTSSCNDTSSPSPMRKKKKRVVEESVAVVKDSSDPYLDFRESMMDMIVEKEMYAWEDLRELLHRLLALNSPYHHHLILRAFAEIWNSLVAPPSPAAAVASPAGRWSPRRW